MGQVPHVGPCPIITVDERDALLEVLPKLDLRFKGEVLQNLENKLKKSRDADPAFGVQNA